MDDPNSLEESSRRTGALNRLRERGVLRVAASYALIAWLALQIADVVLDPLGLPKWVMTALIIAAVVGFPIAIALAWFLEVGDQGVTIDTASDGTPRPTVRGLRHYADAIVIGVLLIAVVVLAVRQSDIGKPKPPENPAIAVLPFDNLSGDPEQEYFSDGLAEEMLDRLGRVPGLRVIARSSSFGFKGRDLDAKAIAEKLDVTTLLEGSVRRDGKRLKLSARLIDGATGQQVWSGSFDREMTDVFAVQAELATAVIDAIVPAARGELSPSSPPTTNLGAHDHYLLGLAGQRARTVQRLAESVAHLEQAVALDPSYAQAHAALATSLLLMNRYSGSWGPAPADALGRAERAAHKALAINPTLSEAHGALGNVLRETGRPGAEDEYRRALELNPNNAVATHDYAVYLSMVPGRSAESDAMTERVLRLDPRSAITWTNKLIDTLARHGAPAYSRQFEIALSVFADDPDALMLVGRTARMGGFPFEAYRAAHAIGLVGDRSVALHASLAPLIAVGAYDQCLAQIDQLRALDADPTVILGYSTEALGLSGRFNRLDELFADARARSDTFDPGLHAVMVFWYSVQGRFDDAGLALKEIGEIPENGAGPMGSTLIDYGLPAMMRIYAATNRPSTAEALVNRVMAVELAELGDAAPDAGFQVFLAAIAATDGRRPVAVGHLQTAMALVPVPNRLYPQLPWFRSLEGEPGYSEIVAELELRRAAIRAAFAKLDASADGARP